MRKIKFRGKCVDDGDWGYGYVIEYLTGRCFIHEPIISSVSKEDMYEYDIIPETLGQFTGLYDKDGKEIYEGDVLQVSPTIYGRGYVIWHDKMAQFVVQMVDSDQWYNIPNGVVEVCGNIHDNSEFLKDSK